jgi:hypothetical protein
VDGDSRAGIQLHCLDEKDITVADA